MNSMTELLSLPEELISWEFDGQAIIATGILLTSLGQVKGCGAEYQHGAVTRLVQMYEECLWLV